MDLLTQLQKLVQSLGKSSDPQTRRSAKELDELTQKLADLQAEESDRLAKRIHDGLQQHLAAARLRIELARRRLPPDNPEIVRGLLEIEQSLDNAFAESRALVSELRTSLKKE